MHTCKFIGHILLTQIQGGRLKTKKRLVLFGLFLLLSGASVGTGQEGSATLPDIDISASPKGVVPFPENTPRIFTDVFSKYTKIVAPNGKPIHFLAQDAWSDDKLVRVRQLMEHMLTDYPGSKYGYDKSVVFNALADRKATMTLFNTSDHARVAEEGPFGSGTDLFRQSLWENETIVEGDVDYMNHITRDASYEEVLHLVQDAGIAPSMPAFQAQIVAAKDAAVERGWGPPNDHPPSWQAEYLAQQYDVFLGLWITQPTKWEGRDVRPGEMPEGTAHWGQNPSNSREELKKLDPVGYQLVSEFFQPYLTYTAELPLDFEGTFSIAFDENLAYTNYSKYLKNVTLRGDSDANLMGNDFPNVLIGNAGENVITPLKGYDLVDGGAGTDTAVFPGNSSEYTIGRQYGSVVVYREDQSENQLRNIEKIRFDDRVLDVADIGDVPILPHIEVSGSKNGIVPLPENVDLAFKLFTKYTKVVAPNGRPIHILAQSGVSERQIVHSREILTMYLTDRPGSLYGSERSIIANTMASRNATLSLRAEPPPGSDRAQHAFDQSGLISQGLGAGEIVIEGTAEYMDPDRPRRNAAYEEILHFVHDQGIIPSGHPMQKALYRALDNALEQKIYIPDDHLPRDSFTQEYIVMGLEAYYGLWQHNPSRDGWASGGEYKFITREDFKNGDPDLFAIVRGLLPDYWTYTAKIAEEFEGTFSLTYDKNLTYTNKSQYLKDVTLTGDNNSNLRGNSLDNKLSGNQGNNVLSGGKGNDALDGRGGWDTAMFSGPFADYRIHKVNGSIIVEDNVVNRDGTDLLFNVEKLKFQDRNVDINGT